MAARRTGEAGFPRSLLIVGAPIAGVLLTAFFIYRGFPYDRLGEWLRAQAGASGVEISFGAIEPHLQLAGPGIEATGVRVRPGDGSFIPLDRAFLRPAWSTSWLKGQPAVYAELESPVGSAEGTFRTGNPAGWSGTLGGVDIARLPVAGFADLPLDGKLDAEIDVVLGESGAEGSVTFSARDGSLNLPDLPMPVPYETLTGDLLLGGPNAAQINSLEIKGPLVDATITGTIGHAASLDASPLSLLAEISARPNVANALKAVGVRLGREGRGKLRITGTLAQPNVR